MFCNVGAVEGQKENNYKGISYLVFVLILTGLLSVFLHETGHGVSAYLTGYPVSTSLIKWGLWEKPSDPDFRAEHKNYEYPWDMGAFSDPALGHPLYLPFGQD